MNKLLILLSILLSVALNANAQRVIDKLDRGVVAVKTTNGVFVSWRIQSDEYYDVTYNLYRDGSLIAENLTTSNYSDAGGTTSNSYTVEAVKHGVKQPKSAATTPWSNSYLEITPKHDKSITSTLVPNDACCADVDGDGELEILLKYDNQSEINASFPRGGHNGEYSIFECLKLDGTVLWWINCGPNMGDFQNNEQNIVAYDWDLDGKAEAIMRAADGTTIHAADGQTYVIGDATKNYRAATGGGTNWFMHEGAEYLVYINGATGVPYVTMDYPLKRLENGETDLNAAWGDGYGHRSSKYFFGAPYLDGRKPSIFLGRGIYTRHKFIAYDVDPATHQLIERWRWTNKQAGSPWYGQGYHNFAIADVDWDGRDEILWGSMVIDDNGKGLSTTGFGHGDAQHISDFNPYVHGQEVFSCMEDNPGTNYRDATTSKLYYRYVAGRDVGRCMAGNFSNAFPGAMGTPTDIGPISLVTSGTVSGIQETGVTQDMRIYWDGDLCEETFDYTNGKNTAGGIFKYGKKNPIATLAGSMTNNDTKGTPCYQGDIFGDWREEVIMRTADNKIRIYTTTIGTPWRNYSLWYDHQYRNAMVWQMCGYNQPPHTSYFLGELEGITAAPPALTMEGRKEIANGGTIANNGEEVITCETNDMTINITDGATPYLYIDNAPSWVQGSAPSEATAASYNIKYQYYTHTLQGGGFSGSTRVVKQGDGILVYPEEDMTYSGNTDVWAGTLNLNGSIANSPLWLNRLTNLNTPAKSITVKSLVADYGSKITIGGEDAIGTLTATDSLKMGFGSRLKMDLYSDGNKADQIETAKLIIETKDWKSGPEYKQPVMEFNCHFANGEEKLAAGQYNLGTVNAVDGDVAKIKIEGIAKVKASLTIEDGRLVLNVEGTRDAADIEWNATQSNVWDVATTENFVTHDDARVDETFIEGDNIYLTDAAQNTTVTIAEGVEVKPANIYYTGSKDYTIGGAGKITAGTFYNNGTGTITMKNENTYTGGNHLTSGTTAVSSLSNAMQAYGNLGGVVPGTKFSIENGAVLQNTAAVTNGSIIRIVNKGVIKTDASFTQQAAIGGDTLVKTGAGSFNMTANLAVARTIVKGGSMDYSGNSYTKPVELQGTVSLSGNGFLGSPIHVAEGAKATLTLTSTNYQAHSGVLTGTGQLTINPTNTVNRVSITGNWTNFRGTIVYNNTSILMPLKNSGMPHATLNTGTNANIGIAASSDNASITYPIGRLTGSGILHHKEMNFGNQNGVSGNVTWKVGSSELGDFTFDGAIYDAGGSNKSNFEKVGDCAMTVGGTWTNSGTVKVSEGSMILGQGKTLGKGALTVAEGATLTGMSSVLRSTSKGHPFTNSSVTINGALRVGSDGLSSAGYWYFGTKPLSFGATGQLYVGVQKCATSAAAPGCTHIWGDESNGSVTFKDGATVCVYLDSTYDPTTSIGTDEAKADSFMVFNFPKATVGDVKFELPELPEHYYWDTTNFKQGYLHIRYTASTEIKGIAAGEMVQVEVVAPNGMMVASYETTSAEAKADFYRQSLPKGVYILRIRSKKSLNCLSVTKK